jgi:minichromosome maintenance protein 10
LSATGTSSNNNPLAKALGFNQATGSTLNLTEKSANRALPKNLMVEPNSKLRVANPVLEKRILSVQMLGKKHIEMYRMKEAVMRKEHEGGDWVSIGVMYYKTSQTSKNGNVYTLWKMTDLQGGEIRSVTVFLFGAAHTRHYKIPLNKVVGILNAKVMDDRSGKGELSLSVDHPDKVLEIGDSLDAGKCKAQKQDGSGCTNLVNLASCEYCSFHVKKAYKAMSSKRGAIQSSFSGNEGVRERIMNKVDPKADYFCSNGVVNKYAGGGGMSGSGGSGGGSGGSGGGGRCGGGSVGRLSQDRRRKDVESLAKLNGTTVGKVLMAEETQNASAHSVMVDGRIRFRSHLSIAEKEVVKKVAHGVSAELGMKLLSNSVGARTLIKTLSEQEKKAADVKQQKGRVENGENESSSSSSSGKSATQLLFEHKKTLAEERARKVLMEKQLAAVPKLGRGFGKGDTIDLTSSSKTKALLALKGKSLDKKQPNYVAGRKRKADDVEKSKAKVAKKLKEKERRSDGNEKSPEKKISTTSKGEVMTKERMDAIRNTKSRHQNLIDSHEDEERDRRFDDLEKKEAMEEKMVNTKEMETRAVTCKACNYTDYKQSGLCRDKGHRIKLIKVKKRFFECKRCKNRTTALDRYPKMSCANCGESAWARVGMMRERKGPTLDSEKLVIRGAEQNFIGADIKSKDLILGL